VDLVISRSVLEHLETPRLFFRELWHILKPESKFIFLTPSRWDYASILVRLIPNRFHGEVVRRTEGRDEGDTFPTFYRANSDGTLKALAKGAGLKIVTLSHLGQYPSYLMFNPFLFLLGTVYGRIVRRFSLLKGARGWILGIVQAPGMLI